MDKIIRSVSQECLSSEWLVTNGLGGYASGTVQGIHTRKYHGVLVAALPPPFGRTIMLSQLIEKSADHELPFTIKSFFLEEGLPVWHLQLGAYLIEKRIFMTYRQNTVYATYELLEGPDAFSLQLFPSFHFRQHEAPVNLPLESAYVVTAIGNRYEISKQGFIPVRMFIEGDEDVLFTTSIKKIENIIFTVERKRGYEHAGDLWNPGFFHLNLIRGKAVGFIASTEIFENINALTHVAAKKAELIRRKSLLHLADHKSPLLQELTLAADQFIIIPEFRIIDRVRAHAFGEEIRTIIAGYHWFSDWGRDTMISLEGLTLCTKRFNEARWILKTFAHYVKDGLIPNMFPEGKQGGIYNTADATLWFFHAIDRYYSLTRDPLILEELLPTLEKIMQAHFHGTHFGIGMDKDDMLLKQGAEHYQLTWMDAKVGDWVVTPRRGKAVEINALWYNALKLMSDWSNDPKKYETVASKVYESFNKKFWIEDKKYLYDVVEENDDAFRPNQLFAISLKYPVLAPSRWHTVVEHVQEKLLTPFGLRTLSMDHPDFKSVYEGDLRTRDAAYHQGTVWPWLMGPFIDAYLKVYPENQQEALAFLKGFSSHLSDACTGTINEVFDAVSPHTPQGCVAQAWSVAEILRLFIKVCE